MSIVVFEDAVCEQLSPITTAGWPQPLLAVVIVWSTGSNNYMSNASGYLALIFNKSNNSTFPSFETLPLRRLQQTRNR